MADLRIKQAIMEEEKHEPWNPKASEKKDSKKIEHSGTHKETVKEK
jgi:hypothetical protein